MQSNETLVDLSIPKEQARLRCEQCKRIRSEVRRQEIVDFLGSEKTTWEVRCVECDHTTRFPRSTMLAALGYIYAEREKYLQACELLSYRVV